MTPEEELAILASTAAGIEDSLQDAFAEMLALIAGGMTAKEAVAQVMEGFTGDMAAVMAQALSQVTGESVTSAQALKLEVGPMALSSRLYAESLSVGQMAQGIVDRHLQGYADARKLALELFEGYNFKPQNAEPLQFNASNDKLPKYLREVLMVEEVIRQQISAAFAKIQVDGLSTGGLKAAYSGLLDAITGIEEGVGSNVVDKRLEIAFYERMRYFAQRIAQTEIHRAYAKREASIIMADPDIEFVQIRRAPGKQLPCICVLYTGRDQYGLGPGVYPKALAPLPPFHPYCLTGDANVSAVGRVLAVSKRWFDGDVVVITTASGKQLTATINHPVLTRRGWVGAGLLNAGDEVLRRVDVVAVGGKAVMDDQHNDVPSSIAEIVDAFLASGEVSARKVPETAEHFHGDGVRGNVAVIGANRELWDRVDAEAAQVAHDFLFEVADPAATGLFGESVADLGNETTRPATNCGVCGGSVGATLFGSQLAHPHDVGGALPSALDSSSVEPPVDHVAADSELARQIQDGSTGEVFADKVVNVERKAFAGHVFNLETDQGHYTANGIVTHNCRCIVAPRLDLTGKKAKGLDEEADAYFLHKLTPSVAARVVGSQAKLKKVYAGDSADSVYNAGIVPQYKVGTVGQASAP